MMRFHRRAVLFLVVFLGCSTTICSGFAVPQQQQLQQLQQKSNSLFRRTALSAGDKTDEINGYDSGISSSVSSLVATTTGSNGDMSRLASAFAALDEGDQYDAVLTGLCAKILDDSTTTMEQEQCKTALQDPIQLIQEMNARRVKASGRSLMAVIDATVAAQDASSMAEIMSLCLKNGGVTQFGAQQNTLIALPSNPSAGVLCHDGSRRTRTDRLQELSDIPVDDRGSEVTSALAFSAFCAACGLANIFGMTDISPYTNTLLVAMTGIGLVDNFYDVIQFVTKAQDKIDISIPEKDSLPLGLGTGQWTGTVFRGLVRLTTVDTERECQCEAAAFYAAYVLGLPCFAFRPNALESAVMVVESIKQDTRLDPLLSSIGILKLLVWLLAPVAMESSKHVQLVVSDPRESNGLLERLEKKADLLQDGDLFWTTSLQEKQDLLKWAYAEADNLLRQNRQAVKEISQRLAGGAATVGDCVAVIEEW